MINPGAYESEDGLPSYLGKLTQAPLLNADEEAALTRAAREGCPDARKRLIESNMRLVISIAKSFHSKSVPLEDLIQEGAIGLINACEKFDPSRGFRFSTYATHWIRQAVGRAIDNKSKAIRLPAHVYQTLRKIERAKLKVMHEIGAEPTFDQVAGELGITPARLKHFIQSSQDLLSLDMHVGDGENTTLGSMIRDSRTTDPEESVLTSEMMEELRVVMQQLSDRERQVMSYRLRLTDEEMVGVREALSIEMNISRERVRQIELVAIKKLRRLAQSRQLDRLLDT